jgi:hypothetical protein
VIFAGAVTRLPSAQLGSHKFSEKMPTPEAPFWLQELHWIFSTKIPPSAQVIVMLLGLYTAVSQSHVSICLGVGAEDFLAEN